MMDVFEEFAGYRQELDAILRLNRIVWPYKLNETTKFMTDCWDRGEKFVAAKCAEQSQGKSDDYQMCVETARRMARILCDAGFCANIGPKTHPNYVPAEHWKLGIAKALRCYGKYSGNRHKKDPRQRTRNATDDCKNIRAGTTDENGKYHNRHHDRHHDRKQNRTDAETANVPHNTSQACNPDVAENAAKDEGETASSSAPSFRNGTQAETSEVLNAREGDGDTGSPSGLSGRVVSGWQTGEFWGTAQPPKKGNAK